MTRSSLPESTPSGRSPLPEVFIFDLDGTLADSFADIAAALNDTRARFGHPPLSEAEVKSQVGSGSDYLVRQLVPVPGDQHQDALRFYLDRYEENALVHTRLFPGVAEVLARYGDHPLAVVTNKNHGLTRKILEGLEVWDVFRIVVGGDSLERKKPDPLPIVHVLEQIGVAPERAVMIGDGLHDIEAGQAAGVLTIAVSTGVESAASLASQHPDHLIDSMRRLPDCFA